MTDILLSVPSDNPKLPSWVEVPAAQVTGIPDSPDDIGAATAEQGARADSAVQPTDLPAFGTAATTDADDYATAAQGALADATTVEQVTLTAPLAYTLPAGTPANTVHRVVFTQDGTGGHPVTYGGDPVTVDTAPNAVTTVELHPTGSGFVVRYPVPGGTYAAATHTHAASAISDSTTVGRSVLTAVDAAAARTAIGAGTSSLAIGTTDTTAAAGNRAASETAIGMVELATTAEATTGTDTTRAVTPAGLKAVADTKAPAATAVTTDTTQTITGAKTITAPTLVAAVPAATFGPELATGPLSTWVGAGGAVWDGAKWVLPAGGTISTQVAVTAGTEYQIDMTHSYTGGCDAVVTLGAVSVGISEGSDRRVTVTAASGGSVMLTIGGPLWAVTVTGVSVRAVTARAGAAAVLGAMQVRASGFNVASGRDSQYSLTTGNCNVASGRDSQRSLTTGNSNVASGYASQYSLTTGNYNVASGRDSQYSLTTGNYNVASGYASQRSLTTGNSNVASGRDSQRSLTTGNSNVASGYASQYSLTTGNYNVASGYASQYSLTTGNYNVASGRDSQYSLTTGNSNVASGYASQRSLTTGNYNVASGRDSQYQPRGHSAWATTTAHRQTSIGHESGQGSATPSDDIVTIGYRAIADGAKAMALGSMADARHAGSVALGSDTITTALAQVHVGPRHLALGAVTAPDAPAAGSGARLYSDVVGGKTRLVVRFAGKTVVLATED